MSGKATQVVAAIETRDLGIRRRRDKKETAKKYATIYFNYANIKKQILMQ